MDLTHSEAFDWRTYVCLHEDANTIVGPGVVRFEVRFLTGREPNGHRLVATLGQQWAFRRCDFVVHRADGTHARLHPDGNGEEANVVIGNLNEWITDARASTPGNVRGVGRDAGHFTRHSPVDSIPAADARVNIDTLLRQHGGILGMLDLTDARKFNWERFLMGRPWGRELLDDGVQSFCVGRDRNGYVYLEN